MRTENLSPAARRAQLNKAVNTRIELHCINPEEFVANDGRVRLAYDAPGFYIECPSQAEARRAAIEHNGRALSLIAQDPRAYVRYLRSRGAEPAWPLSKLAA